MSRIGKIPIPIPKTVKVTLEGDRIVVEGPKGKHEERIHRNMVVEIGPEQVVVSRPDDSSSTSRSTG